MKNFKHAKAVMKTAREINSPFAQEIHIVGETEVPCCIGELFKACGWVVIYEKSKVGKGNRNRVQPRTISRRRSRGGSAKNG